MQQVTLMTNAGAMTRSSPCPHHSFQKVSQYCLDTIICPDEAKISYRIPTTSYFDTLQYKLQSRSSFPTAFASFVVNAAPMSVIPANPSHPSILSIDFIFHQRHPVPIHFFVSFFTPFHLFASFVFICPVSPILVAHNQPVQNIARRSAVAAIALKSKLYVHCVDAYVKQYVARK